MISKPSKQYTISAGFARDKGITRVFVASTLIETERAVYLYGHGTTDPVSGCARCGRTLTHPGSILIGIGPECLSKMTMGCGWELRAQRFNFQNPDPADVEQLKNFTRDIKVDGWFPKSVLLQVQETEGQIQVPGNHPKLSAEDRAKGGNGSEPPKPSKTVTLDSSGKFAIIKFDYDAKLVDEIRRLEGRRWNSERKFWSAWASVENLTRLQELGFELSESLLSILNPPKTEEVQIDEEVLNLPGAYPFQLDGIRWLISKDGNGLIGDEQGLGKTIQALGYLKLTNQYPACIVVPASLKLNWEREAKKWISKQIKVQLLYGKSPTQKDLKKVDIYIINYDILGAWVPILKKAGIKILIGDEIQACKNIKTQRTKAFKELSKTVGRTLGLSGTPITNRPVEFYTFLNILDPLNFNSWMRYVQRYCGAKHTGFGWDVSGASNIPELHEKVSRVMLRRKKADVLKELPAKRHLMVVVDIDNREEYQKADSDLIRWVKERFGNKKADKTATAEALTRFNYMKQLAADGKSESVINWLSDFLENNGKVVVFCNHLDMVDKLVEGLRNFGPVTVDGRVKIEQRQAAVDRFQNDPTCKVFVGNQAAETGLTLTAASNVVHVEFPWTPGALDQRSDRIHRIGQEADSVNVWHLMAEGTIEEEIVSMLDSKRQVLDAVLDGTETEEGNLLQELIQRRMEG